MREVKNLPGNAGGITDRFDPWVRKKSLGERHDNPPQYSCLENPMDRGAWQACKQLDMTEVTADIHATCEFCLSSGLSLKHPELGCGPCKCG